MCALVPVRVRRRLTTSNLTRPIFTRAALTISGKSPEKFKIGIKPIIRDLVKYGHVLVSVQRSTTRLAANKPAKASGELR
jgi:hypothetical protein